MFPYDVWEYIISFLMPQPHNLAVCKNLYENIKKQLEEYVFPMIIFQLPPFKIYFRIYLQVGIKHAVKITRLYYHKRKCFYIKLSKFKKNEFYLDKFTKIRIRQNIMHCEFFETPNLYIVSKSLPNYFKFTST